MPAPRILPPSDVLLQMRNSGYTYADIASEFGVTVGAVYLQLRQARATSKRPSYKHLIPWTVRTDHAHAHPVTMLRLLGRRQNGETLAVVKSRLLDRWLEGMGENGLVLCYHPDAPPNPASRTTGGFYYKRRQESDGDSLVREADDTFTRECETAG